MPEPTPCPSCGSAIRPDSKFCYSCGAKLQTLAAPNQLNSASPEYLSPQSADLQPTVVVPSPQNSGESGSAGLASPGAQPPASVPASGAPGWQSSAPITPGPVAPGPIFSSPQPQSALPAPSLGSEPYSPTTPPPGAVTPYVNPPQLGYQGWQSSGPVQPGPLSTPPSPPQSASQGWSSGPVGPPPQPPGYPTPNSFGYPPGPSATPGPGATPRPPQQFNNGAPPNAWSPNTAPGTPPVGMPGPGPQYNQSPAGQQVFCFQHPGIVAIARCSRCGAPVCATCDFRIPPPPESGNFLLLSGDRHMCPNCASRPAYPVGPPGMMPPRPMPQQRAIPLGSGIMCTQHPAMAAVRHCHICSTPMCQTCDFELPGHFHVCPTCAANPKTEMSSGRKRNLIIGYALAAWTTLGVALMFSGVFAQMVTTRSDREALGYAIWIFVYLPSLVGVALSVSSIDRKLGTPGVVWGAVIWNAVILATLVIRYVIVIVG